MKYMLTNFDHHYIMSSLISKCHEMSANNGSIDHHKWHHERQNVMNYVLKRAVVIIIITFCKTMRSFTAVPFDYSVNLI